MMAAALRALPVTFAIYVIEALLALQAALPPALALTGELGLGFGGPSWDDTRRAIALEQLVSMGSGYRVSLIGIALSGATLLLVSAWLHMSWLCALGERSSAATALLRGVRLVPRAWAISLLVGALGLLAAAPCLAGAYALHRWLDAPVLTRTHDLALLAALAPLALVAGLGHVLHDLSRARARDETALRSVRASLRGVLRPGLLGRALGLWLLGLALLAAAAWVGSWLDASWLGGVWTTAVWQSALLGRLFLRSLWLACAIDAAEAGARRE